MLCPSSSASVHSVALSIQSLLLRLFLPGNTMLCPSCSAYVVLAGNAGLASGAVKRPAQN
eukprot:scaffold32899_cov20-Tisochrysis_lutea.AAC.6